MIDLSLIDPGVCARLCLTLLHSLWQMAALAVIAWSFQRWKRDSVEVQYSQHLAALCLGLLALPITYLFVEAPELTTGTVGEMSQTSKTPIDDALSIPKGFVAVSNVPTADRLLSATALDATQANVPLASMSADPVSVPLDVILPSSAPSAAAPPKIVPQTSISPTSLSSLFDIAPWLLMVYVTGVALMLLRLLVATYSSNRFVTAAKRISDGYLAIRLQALADRWSMKVTPALAVADQVIVPQIVGLWRPVILLPTAAVTGMTTTELELILTHEMAHLRRHDMWVHLLQRMAETLLFFNPALWLLNRRISLLREFCCDDLTLQTQRASDREPELRYAAALLKVVEACNVNRIAQADLATLAASGHSPSELRRRIARLFGEPLREPLGMSRGGLLAICGAVLLLIGPMLWPVNAAQDNTTDAPPSAVELVIAPKAADKDKTETNAADEAQQEPENSGTQQDKSRRQTQVLRGTITNASGKPIPNVKITLYRGFATRFPGQETTSDTDGKYKFNPHTTIQSMGGFENPYAFTGMTFTHTEFVPKDGQLFRDVPIESNDQVFDLEMVLGGKVKGVVRDHETGKPIAGLGLRMGDGFFKGRKDRKFMVSSTTNGAGEFEFDPAPPRKYVIEINESDYRGKQRYLKIAQVDVESGNTTELQLKDVGLKQLEDPFQISGTAFGNDGKSMVYGGVGVNMVDGEGKFRSRGGGIDGRPKFGLSFGPIKRSKPTKQSPYGIGTHDVEIIGSNSRFGYRLVSRTPAEPLRITDDPSMPELKDGIRYLRPNKPVEFQLVYAPNDKMSRMFSLKVVGPDGESVPNARVQLRTKPGVTKSQIHRGEYLKDGRYGNEAIANKDGELYFTLSQRPSRFNLKIQHPGFAPYWASWSPSQNGEPIPNRFTAKLDAGWSVGGVVVDQDGKPVEGVEVSPGIKYKMRPGDTSSMGVGTNIKTDSEGKWRFDCVPVSKGDVHVEVSHPSFQPHYQQLARDTFGLEKDAEPSETIQLKRGQTVTGLVTDEAGQPIAGALVRTKFLNDLREARTNKAGVYRLEGCDSKMARIVVSAKGKATDLQTVRVDQNLGPVNFVMKPGGRVKIRVVDEQGNPIPKARIFYQRWRGDHAYWEFDHKHDYADENGIWEWNEAPLDEFSADICRPGGMQLSYQKLVAREKEYVFTPPKALVVSGTVVDAKTKKPVPNFRATPGLRNKDPRIGINWDVRSSFEATKGKYSVRQTREQIAHMIRIEAEGYKVAVSRDIQSNEGAIEINFELEPAADIAATVQSSEGIPAVGAKIALGVAGSQINIENGDVDDSSTYATRVNTDAKGQFNIPSREETFQLVITHAEGFAYFKSPEQAIDNVITLTPWARGEGTFQIGNTPMPNVRLERFGDGLHSYGADVPSIFTHNRVTTGKNGRFEFPRMFPGKARIGRSITLMVDDGATEVTSSIRQATEFTSGQTTTLKLGGTGRPVAGKLIAAADFKDKVLWNFVLIRAEADLPVPEPEEAPADVQDDPVARKNWWDAWKTSEQGQKWLTDYREYNRIRSESPYITATVDRDGSFRIDDAPPGKYVLSARFSSSLDRPSPGSLRNVKFEVPSVEEGQPTEALNLGTLQLE